MASSEDAGYWSPEQVADERVEGIDLQIATGRDKHGTAEETAASTDAVKEANALNQMKQKRSPHASFGGSCAFFSSPLFPIGS